MHLYGLIIGIALVVGIEYFIKNNQVISKSRENIFIFGLLISGLIGARLWHVIDQWSYYSKNLSQIFATWNGGLGIYGALITMTIFTFFFAKLYKISLLKILDTITPILPLCQAIGRFGNFINHEIPTWWIEASLNLVLFFVLKKSQTPTAHYLIAYGLIRFFIEFFRNDTWQINGFKIAQLFSIFGIITGLFILKKFRRVGN